MDIFFVRSRVDFIKKLFLEKVKLTVHVDCKSIQHDNRGKQCSCSQIYFIHDAASFFHMHIKTHRPRTQTPEKESTFSKFI